MRTLAAALLLAATALTGCATWSKHGVAPTPPLKLLLAVPPPVFSVQVRHLTDIEDPPPGPALSKVAERAEIAAATASVAGTMAAAFERRLAESYFFAPVSSGAACDATLRVTVLGYGRIKPSWVWLLLGSGVVEGGSQAAIVLEASGSGAAAAAVGGEEVVQELAEDVGGVFLFDHFFTPVILKAELVSAKDGKVVWRRWALGTRNRKALKILPPQQRKLKAKRLELVFDAAREELVRSLEKAALKNQLEPK